MPHACVLLLCLAASARPAPAAAAPPDESAFTATMAERFRAALPGERVAVAGPQQLRVGDGGEADETEVNLGRVVAL